MKGDYYRYLAEVAAGEDKNGMQNSELAVLSYLSIQLSRALISTLRVFTIL